jgi:prepilin-type N-terminal cleavage/methylation domain-containing protein/prepilin-type processing-associated H-X9-DG protein
MSRRHYPRAAFTLVELLVVIGIIALLISMLLPALARARESANSVACMANLRSAGQAMQMYVSEYKGFIPGSPVTSSRHFFNAASTATLVTITTVPPGPIQSTDFIHPLATMMRIKFPSDDNPDIIPRYQYYRDMPQFLCPTNRGVMVPPFISGTSADAGVGPHISYATALTFLLTPATPTPGITRVTRMSSGAGWWVLPNGYTQKITKIGQNATKIYMADAGKFSTTTPPNYNLAVAPVDGGIFSDFGAFGPEAEGYFRTVSPSGFDPRIFAWRHGKKNALRLNALFYDGHVESLDEMQTCNPSLWVPKGTTFPDTGKIWPDVVTAYGLGASFTVNN